MIKEYKKLLIVDDSEIDRMVLQSILWDEFDIIEANNGYEALEIILGKAEHLDAILLDVSMPVIDGFGVLKLMKENGINDIPVFLITAEATKDNVEKAAQYNISEFIGKPFERNIILSRLKAKLGIVIEHNLSETDIKETNKYISDLKNVYNKYLLNFGKDSKHYERVSNLMKILLNKYAVITPDIELDRPEIDIISKAAYFYDIGNMLIPDERILKRNTDSNNTYQNHTSSGSDIVRLNHSKHCEYFVHICSDMCNNHHEKYDGTGYPNNLSGDRISVYSQMCSLLDEFDKLFFQYNVYDEKRFDFVLNTLLQDKGAANPNLISLLASCRPNITVYYSSKA